jgi:hypothetical protein
VEKVGLERAAREAKAKEADAEQRLRQAAEEKGEALAEVQR